MTPRKAAVLAVNLPQGAQTWVDFGGPMAIEPGAEAVYVLEASLNAIAWAYGGKNGNQPEMRDYPELTTPIEEKPKELSRLERWQKAEAQRQARLNMNSD